MKKMELISFLVINMFQNIKLDFNKILFHHTIIELFIVTASAQSFIIIKSELVEKWVRV